MSTHSDKARDSNGGRTTAPAQDGPAAKSRIARLLLVAYACHPTRGGETGVGWQSLQAALRVADEVLLITHSPFVDEVREQLRLNGTDRVEVVGVGGSPAVRHLAWRVPGLSLAYYQGWQVAAGLAAARAHQRKPFQVGHHATFGADWSMSALSFVKDLPWIWGPVGGSSMTPLRLWRYLGPRGVLFELARRVLVPAGIRLFGLRAARSAQTVLAQNHDVAARFRRWGAVSLQPSPAIDVRLRRTSETGSREWLCVGRLIAWKGWALAIEAMRYADSDVRLTFYGEGSDKARLQRLVQAHGLGDRVTFAGTVPRDELMQHLSTCRGIVFPSFRDPAPWSVAEALSIGVPVIGLDLAGVKTLLEAAGVRPVAHRRRDLAEHIGGLMSRTGEVRQTDVWSDENFYTRIGEELSSVAR